MTVEILLAIIGLIGLVVVLARTAPLWLTYLGPESYRLHPAVLEKRTRQAADRDYQEALRVNSRNIFPTVEDFGPEMLVAVLAHTQLPAPPDPIIHALMHCAREIYAAEDFAATSVSPPPAILRSAQGGRWFDKVHQIIAKHSDPSPYETARAAIVDSLSAFLRRVPPIPTASDDSFHVPLIDTLPDAGTLIDEMTEPFHRIELGTHRVFQNLRKRLDYNRHDASGVTPGSRSPKLIPPSKYNGPDVVKAYLQGTPLLHLLSTQIPFTIPQHTRFEHHWIVAPQGAGKTQTLQHLILKDIQKVIKDEASLVVIDSQGDLIKNIAGLKLFASGQALVDKLILIEPDPDYPLAINPFDVQIVGSSRERERLTNTALELLTYVFGSLLAAEMTPKQETLFRYIIRALMIIPSATILTFNDFLTGNQTKYQPYIDQLEGPAKQFFETQFNDPKQFGQTKQEVAWRLMYMLENTTFARMFSSPKNKLNLFEELNTSKVILINTDRDLLKERTELFGRLFIAMLLQASEQRATLDRSKRLPVFCYIDECHDYIARDTKITSILDQARKMNVGLILANQRLSQITAPNVLDALMNVSIKFARAVNDSDAHALARNMQTTPEFLVNQPEQTFAASVRGITREALSLKVPFFVMEKLTRMTSEEQQQIRNTMRKRYSAGASERRSSARASAEPSQPPNEGQDWSG